MKARMTPAAGPAERAHHAGDVGPAPAREDWRNQRRMPAKRKQSAVLRLRRGEDLELLSRELGVTIVGELTMANELLDARIERLETHQPLGRPPRARIAGAGPGRAAARPQRP